jgi:hypothetical protein
MRCCAGAAAGSGQFAKAGPGRSAGRLGLRDQSLESLALVREKMTQIFKLLKLE